MYRVIIILGIVVLFLSGCRTKKIKASDINLTEVQRDHIEKRIDYMTVRLRLTKKQQFEVRQALTFFSKEIQAIRLSNISGNRRIDEVKKVVKVYEKSLKEILTEDQYRKYYKLKWDHIRKIQQNSN